VLRQQETYGKEIGGLGELIISSQLIVEGWVVAERVRLSEDELTVVTDYTVEVLEPVVDNRGWTGRGNRLVVRRPGGQLLIEGTAVSVETPDFPRLLWLVRHLFFLQRGEDGTYTPNGGAQGVWEVDDGRVYSLLPEKTYNLVLRRNYHRWKAKDFYRWVRGTGTAPQKQ
jgi:hypothetical protein